MIIGTWNVRSLCGVGCARIVDQELSKYKADIVAVQETHWPDQGTVEIKDYTLLYSGREDGVHRQGVGFLCKTDYTHQSCHSIQSARELQYLD